MPTWVILSVPLRPVSAASATLIGSITLVTEIVTSFSLYRPPASVERTRTECPFLVS